MNHKEQLAEKILKDKKRYLSQPNIPDYLRRIVTYEDAIAAIVEAMDVKPDSPRWVKASERLPEAFKTVLIWDEDNIEQGYLAKNGFFVCERIMVESRTVTHWMPLPAPPSESPTKKDDVASDNGNNSIK